jgi:NAD(P)-dependent dehydrogenase (short-subunit alcohol dehydrogenase family)
MPKVAGAVVVVTGASSGIGRATALELARRGARAVVAARSDEPLETLVGECRAFGADALDVPTDVADAEAVDRLAQAAVEHFGRIDAWVNNASVSLVATFEETPEIVFRQVIETNLFGVVHGSRAALRQFRDQGSGVLINVASAYGRTGSPYLTAYAATKHAVVGFTQSLRMELRDVPDIHVSTVMPAAIDTPFFHHSGNYTGRQFKPIRPFYQPEVVARQIADLVERPRPEVFAGIAGRLAALSRAVAPRLHEAVLGRLAEADHFADEPAEPGPGNIFEPAPPEHRVHGGWREREPSLDRAVTAGLVGAAGGLLLAVVALRRSRD